MCLPPLLFVRKPPLRIQKKRPQSVSGQRSLIEYVSNAKSLKKWMYAIHIGHIRKPKQLKKNTILQKEFNLPKKKECNKPIYTL